MNDPFQTECFYHVYNHANGNENLFRYTENYNYFLKKYGKYIEPVAETLCYCLMPNHFHFLIRVKNESSFCAFIESSSGKPLQGFQTLEGMGAVAKIAAINRITTLQFSHLFNCYTQSYNRLFNRKGSLFIPRFNRKEIDSNDYLTKIIHYIHYNPIHHGFCKSIDVWPFSSYKTILSDKPTKLSREMVLQWFGGHKEYIQFHKWQPVLRLE